MKTIKITLLAILFISVIDVYSQENSTQSRVSVKTEKVTADHKAGSTTQMKDLSVSSDNKPSISIREMGLLDLNNTYFEFKEIQRPSGSSRWEDSLIQNNRFPSDQFITKLIKARQTSEESKNELW